MTLNTYGLKMTGLKKISGDSKNLGGYYSGEYIQISYDKSIGCVYADYHYSLGHNSWTVYHDSDIVSVGNISAPATMQEIADMIYTAVSRSNILH